MELEQKATQATSAGSRDIDISGIADRVMLQAVEYPAGCFPKIYQRFSLWGDTLTLLGEDVPDGSNAYIYYGKLHILNVSGSTIPAAYEDFVSSGAGGYAAVEWAAFSINRVNVGGEATPRQFMDWGRERLSYFKQELKRLGRCNRARIDQLYKPAYTAASKTTDYGP